MILEAWQFEKNLAYHSGWSGDSRFGMIDYDDEGTGILLRVIDIRTYGGKVSLFIGPEGKTIETGSTTTPMRVRRPFRLGPMNAYVVHFHLSIQERLPDNVVAHIVPTKKLGELGCLITDIHTVEGDLVATIVPLRMIEVEEGYPIASLTFLSKAYEEKYDASKKVAVVKEATIAAPKIKTKGTKNAKNTSTRK
jgi:hypothetical protein